MIRNFFKRFNSILEYRYPKLINTSLCGVQLRLHKGTLRKKVDKDDAWWFYLAKNHETIIDIGCNVGYTALLALILNPNKRIILIDPNPKALKIAFSNLVTNNLCNGAQFVSSFVGNANNGWVRFYTLGTGAAGSMYASHAKTADEMNSFLEVKTVTLDHLVYSLEIEPHLVKIDVEGAENLVMEGAKSTAKLTKCSFFVELHRSGDLDMLGTAEFMLEWCAEMKYTAWYPKTGQVLTDANVLKNRGKCHLLLLPNEKEYPNYLKNVIQNAPLPNTL